MKSDTARSGFFWIQIVCIVVLGIAGHYALSIKYGIPIPTIHDEFAYLLSADTFAQGRLTNPTHPLWEHFQTFHVFFSPTYQAKYPPLQGMFMAFGQRLFGVPIWGVWISLALAYGATFWLFLSKFRPPYALAGTLVLIANPFIALHWGHTYWGGAVAMLGGALFFGGILRSRLEVKLSSTMLLCIGLIVLANSRPFESFVLFVISIPMLIKIALRNSAEKGGAATFKTFILPIAVLGGMAIAWLLYYNAALTGDPFKFYYKNWNVKSATVDLIKNYVGSPPLSYTSKLGRLWDFFIGPYLSLAIVGILFILKRREMIFELTAIIGLTIASIMYSKAWPHYLAPIASLVYLIIFRGFYEIKNLELFKSKKMSHFIFAAAMSVYFVIAVSGTYALFEKGPARPYIGKLRLRKEIARKLNNEPGKDLMIVSYGPNHNSHEEWVYNRANIDNAKIVWARDLGKQKNQRLFDYYKQRTVWVLYPDRKPIGLMKLHDATP